MKKAVIIIVVLAAAGYLGWRIYVKASELEDTGGGRRDGGGAVVAVETAPVKKEMILDVARFSGSLQADTYFIVAPKVSGRLEQLMVDIGDTVESGDLVAVIDDDEYAQQAVQAKAEFDVARANQEEAKSALDAERREFERVEALRAKQIASESEFDGARARYEAQDARYRVAQAQVSQREAALKAAEVRLSYTRISAAWEGGGTRSVAERFVDEGAMLRANDQIVSIIDIGSLTAVVNVIERDYSKITIGQEALVTTDAYPGRTFVGRVQRVAPLLRETTRQARVEIDVPNADGLLKPGMFVLAEIEFGRHENATVVALSALARRDGQMGVFTIDTDAMKATFVPVTTGIRTEEAVEITDPPLEGIVVTLGQHLLSDGASVSLPAAGGGDI